MKRTVTVVRQICDVCEKNEAYPWNACLGCGKLICYDCRKTSAKEYPHGVHVGGSGDGIYCNHCDARLSKSGTDQMFNAYQAIQSLRHEAEGFYATFEKRREIAEADLKQLQRNAETGVPR